MTLIEVLVSIAIFALAAIALGAAYVNTLEGLRRTVELERDAGDWRAVRTILLQEADRATAEKGGEMSLPDGRRVRWSVAIRPTAVADLFTVDLTGSVVTDSGDELAHREMFRVLRPTWSEAAEREELLAAARARRLEERRP